MRWRWFDSATVAVNATPEEQWGCSRTEIRRAGQSIVYPMSCSRPSARSDRRPGTACHSVFVSLSDRLRLRLYEEGAALRSYHIHVLLAYRHVCFSLSRTRSGVIVRDMAAVDNP